MSSNPEQPLVSIGSPTYNNPQLLHQALGCLTKQSFKNLEIIISDDCSPGEETQKVVQEFMEKDSRIKHYRQKKNLGPRRNHRFVHEKATGEYFFWASEDDEWNEKFIETGVRTLVANPYYDAWCCTINNIDSFGRVIREYPGFSRFTSTQDKRKDIIKYLFEPGIMGKPNIFHSIYRRDALSKTIKEYPLNSEGGSDMCFNLAFLTRFNLIATDEVLFHKRVVRESDEEIKVNPIVINNPYRRAVVSPKFYLEYYMAARKSKYEYLVFFTLILIWPYMVIRKYLSNEYLKMMVNRVLMKFGYRFVKVRENETSAESCVAN